ncbi:immunity protein Imm33 domain-containing protein [Paenibacillus sp. Soil750]|uniref:immunity protein Imm33 domain-containing protein n=1 Tax=Paenibacillus sp. Soil750 TaxID=1736398 RepID=UPI0006FEBCD9|nr:DUF2185 domain-containing protein [Paenibacillus sp. Soil750]KRE61932.1 hypothetical protein ASL11_23795 [Paenibacillus sp. Soil750]
MEWSLEDVEKTKLLNPNTFFIPSQKDRQKQKKGDLVRLHFILNHPSENDPRAERMWVEITEKKLFSHKYIGILTNQPTYINSLHAGDKIEFEPKHIARIIIPKGDPRWLDSGEKMALVSNKCLEEGACVRWLYRETPDQEEDSGWRLFEGTETDEYNSESSNIRIVNIYSLLDKDPSLITPLRGAPGTAFERENIYSRWIEVKDWMGL